MSNPFRPRFSTTPPLLAGRGVQTEDFTHALRNRGSMSRATIYTGPRGVGIDFASDHPIVPQRAGYHAWENRTAEGPAQRPRACSARDNRGLLPPTLGEAAPTGLGDADFQILHAMSVDDARVRRPTPRPPSVVTTSSTTTA